MHDGNIGTVLNNLYTNHLQVIHFVTWCVFFFRCGMMAHFQPFLHMAREMRLRSSPFRGFSSRIWSLDALMGGGPMATCFFRARYDVGCVFAHFVILGSVEIAFVRDTPNHRLAVPFGSICQISQQGEGGEGGLFRNLANRPK